MKPYQILSMFLLAASFSALSQPVLAVTPDEQPVNASVVNGANTAQDPLVIPQDPPVVVSEPVRAPQIARFEGWLDIIERDLVGPEMEVVDRLVANKVRAAVFNIQALGRLYRDQNPLFNTLHKNFQKLEDEIGEYQKWNDYTNEGIKTGVGEAKILELTQKRERAKLKLAEVLTSYRFLPTEANPTTYIQQLRKDLETYAWKDYETDKAEIRAKLVKELDTIKTTKYDFTHLEHGNGVHEFRRKMRWFSMETRGLNGLVILKDTVECPVAHYANIIYQSIATTKYAVLPPAPTEINPIQLTPCLYVKVADLVERVNWIKAKQEAIDTLSETGGTDIVPEADQATLKAIWDDIVATDLFGRLQEEVANN